MTTMTHQYEEEWYVQIEKEILKIVFETSKFHKLIHGKSDVVIESDIKPLETLMGIQK